MQCNKACRAAFVEGVGEFLLYEHFPDFSVHVGSQAKEMFFHSASQKQVHRNNKIFIKSISPERDVKNSGLVCKVISPLTTSQVSQPGKYTLLIYLCTTPAL